MQIEPKKIMFVVPSLRGGGAEKVAVTLLEALQRLDSSLKIVVVLFHKKPVSGEGRDISFRYLDVSETRNIFQAVIKFFRVIRRLTGIIKQERPASILSFMDYVNVVCIISNRLSGIKSRMVLTVHILPTDQMHDYADSLQEKILWFIARLAYKSADAIIAVSRGVCNDLVKNMKVREDLVHVIHNPLDIQKVLLLSGEALAEQFLSEDVPVILAVGRLVKQKGFDYLLKAFSLLKKKCDARLVILGEGEEESRLRELSGELGIAGNVSFPGYKDNPYKYMKHAALFVLPSIYEGFGIVITEAMVCGTPVIATRSYDGIEDIIEHEKNGLLVPAADEHALAEAMFRLLSDRSLRRSLAEAAKKKADDFSMEKIASQYKAVLDV